MPGVEGEKYDDASSESREDREKSSDKDRSSSKSKAAASKSVFLLLFSLFLCATHSSFSVSFNKKKPKISHMSLANFSESVLAPPGLPVPSPIMS